MLGLEQVVGQLQDQWADGRVPQITYNPDVPDQAYFPGPDFWKATAPSGVKTTGFIQPPTQARAMAELLKAALERGGETAEKACAEVQANLPRLLAWHNYLHENRDPGQTGVVLTLSSWETGMDNLSNFVEPNANIEIPKTLPAFTRRDVNEHNRHMRPDDRFYEGQVTSILAYQRAGFDDTKLRDVDYPYQVRDPHMAGILLDAHHAVQEVDALLKAAGEPGLSPLEGERIEGWKTRIRAGLERLWDDEVGGPVPFDERSGKPLRNRSIGVFGPMISGDMTAEQFRAQRALLFSEHFIGHPDNQLGLPPSTAITDRHFDPNRYWLGPVWPREVEALSEGLERFALKSDVPIELRWQAAKDADLLASRLALMLLQSGRDEYNNVFTREGLGAEGQSWSAWLRLELSERPTNRAQEKLEAALKTAR